MPEIESCCFLLGVQVVESASVSVTPRIIPRTSCIIVTMAHIRALVFVDRVGRGWVSGAKGRQILKAECPLL